MLELDGWLLPQSVCGWSINLLACGPMQLGLGSRKIGRAARQIWLVPAGLPLIGFCEGPAGAYFADERWRFEDET